MGCFSLAGVANLLIWVAVVVGVILIVRIVLREIIGRLPAGNVILEILNVILWVAVLIVAIVFVFELLSCLPSMRLR